MLSALKQFLGGLFAEPAPAGAFRRNDPCPCGSGAKYKRCCLDKHAAAVREKRFSVGGPGGGGQGKGESVGPDGNLQRANAYLKGRGRT